jgi:ubiquinol-cytochrome c reductase cytochrome c subunit
MRRLLRTRLLAPAALAGCVGLVGLLTFPAGPAQAGGTPSTATLTSRSLPTVGAVLSFHAPSDHSGIDYVSLPQSFVSPGRALFEANCSSCHGSDAAGRLGIAPNLQELGAGTVDFWVSTGRMPLAVSSAQATRKPPRFSRLQTLEIASWVQSLTPGIGTQIPVVDTSGASLSTGATLFTLNCAACHTITGAGDALMEGAYAPSLHAATTTQIVEAIRSGPGNMPHFGPGNITDAEARDIATYVHSVIQHPSNPGGFGLGGVGPVGEGFVGLLIGVGILMLVCFWIGDRT